MPDDPGTFDIQIDPDVGYLTSAGAHTDRQDWADDFLDTYAACGSMRIACDTLGISHKTVWYRRKNDLIFADKYAKALDQIRDLLYQANIDRALNGQQRTYINKDGDPITVTEHDNRQLQYVSERLDPDTWAPDRKALDTGDITVVVMIGDKTPNAITTDQPKLELVEGEAEEIEEPDAP